MTAIKLLLFVALFIMLYKMILTCESVKKSPELKVFK